VGEDGTDGGEAPAVVAPAVAVDQAEQPALLQARTWYQYVVPLLSCPSVYGELCAPRLVYGPPLLVARRTS
jgi:hypothetical protein